MERSSGLEVFALLETIAQKQLGIKSLQNDPNYTGNNGIEIRRVILQNEVGIIHMAGGVS